MEFNEYQLKAQETAMYPPIAVVSPNGSWSPDIYCIYPALGLAGEAGEVANDAKKIIRDDGGIVTTERRAKMILELGDTLWYISETARQLGVTLDDIAKLNIQKLQNRHN